MFAALLLSFGVIFVAELGDKSQLMAMTFALRYRWWVVLTGVAIAAFTVHGFSVAIGHFLGRRYESPSEYTEYIANKMWVDKTTSGPFQLELAATLDPVEAGTKITAHYRGESRGFFRLAEPLVVRLTKRQAEAAGENLKALLEEHAL